MSFCCAECFSHPWLREFVVQESTSTDDCDFCGSENVPVIEVGDLSGAFGNMMSLYGVAESFEAGDLIVDLVQEDWDVFSQRLLDQGDPGSLLEEALNAHWDDDSGESPFSSRELYQRVTDIWHHTSMADEWEEYCRVARSNPPADMPLPQLFAEDVSAVEVRLPSGAMLYRARAGFASDADGRERPWSDREIGPPPPEKAKAARANAEGEVVLYVADHEATAVAEVRPARGEWVSVGRFESLSVLRLVDLSIEPPWPNPFVSEWLVYKVEFHGLLRTLGEELGRPLRRSDDPSEYLVSQRLVQAIRDAGYAGVRYPSAMAPEGTNIVLFDPGRVRFLDSEIVKVSEVRIDYERALGDRAR